MKSLLKTLFFIEIVVLYLPLSMLVLVGLMAMPLWITLLFTDEFMNALYSILIEVFGLIGLVTIFVATSNSLFNDMDISQSRQLKIGFFLGLLGLLMPVLAIFSVYIPGTEANEHYGDEIQFKFSELLYLFPFILSIQIGYGLGLFNKRISNMRTFVS